MTVKPRCVNQNYQSAVSASLSISHCRKYTRHGSCVWIYTILHGVYSQSRAHARNVLINFLQNMVGKPTPFFNMHSNHRLYIQQLPCFQKTFLSNFHMADRCRSISFQLLFFSSEFHEPVTPLRIYVYILKQFNLNLLLASSTGTVMRHISIKNMPGICKRIRRSKFE